MHVMAECKQPVNECGEFSDPYHRARPFLKDNEIKTH